MKKAILLWTTVLFATSLAYAVPNLTVLWQKEYRDPYQLHQTACAALQAFDVDKDGDMEVVLPFRKDADRIVCIKGSDGSVEWVFPPMTQDGMTTGDPMGAPCIGDMDGDGKHELLFTGRSSTLYCLDAATGTKKWTFECGGKDEAVCLFDINKDGKKEAVFQAGSSITVVDYSGKLLWSYQMTTGASTAPNAFDLDRDGEVEIVCGDGAGTLYCMSSTGVEKWRFVTAGKFHHQQPVIADFNNDGEYEIAVHSNDRYLYMVSFFGTEIWRYPVDQYYWAALEDAGQHEGGVSAADLDGDGKIEILTSSVIGSIYCINADGTRKWFYKTPNEVWSGILVCDFTGDGKLDVVVEGEENETHSVYPYGLVGILSASGVLQYAYPQGLTASTPSAADLNKDGKVDLVAQAWSAPVMGLTANAAYNAKLMPWPYKYKTASNNAVYPIAETFVLLFLPAALWLGMQVGRRR